MFKMVGLLKRRPGMSAQEFRDYYESKHRVIGEKYLAGYAVYYKRRFLQGFADPITGAEVEQDFDVLLEIGYKDEAAFAKANESFAQEPAVSEIAEDEEKLFDREKSRFFFVREECESEL